MDVSLVRPTFDKATVKWTFRTKTAIPRPWSVLFLEVKNATARTEYTFLLELKSQNEETHEFSLPKEIICAGHEYEVTLKVKEMLVFGAGSEKEGMCSNGDTGSPTLVVY